MPGFFARKGVKPLFNAGLSICSILLSEIDASSDIARAKVSKQIARGSP